MHSARTAALLVCGLWSTQSLALELVCNGTMYVYADSVTQGTGSISIEIDEQKGTLTIRGLISGSGTGELKAETERMQTFILMRHVIQGAVYPYVFVNVDRYSGEALVMALSEPALEGAGRGLFSGTCTKQSRLF